MKHWNNLSLHGLLLLVALFSATVSTAFAAETTKVNTQQLASPEVPQSALFAWTERAVTNTLSYDYNNYQQVFKDASTYFTPDAWKEFYAALEKSGNITLVVKHKLAVKVTSTGTAKILDQGIVQGGYTWKIAVPVQVVFTNPANPSSSKIQKGTATVQVSRVPKEVNAQGLAIVSFSTAFK